MNGDSSAEHRESSPWLMSGPNRHAKNDDPLEPRLGPAWNVPNGGRAGVDTGSARRSQSGLETQEMFSRTSAVSTSRHGKGDITGVPASTDCAIHGAVACNGQEPDVASAMMPLWARGSRSGDSYFSVMARQCAQARECLRAEPVEARRVLGACIDGRLTFRPVRDEKAETEAYEIPRTATAARS